METNWSYPGRELESMAFAVNYHRWILDSFRPFLGKRLVEVGAGAGSFSAILLETHPDSLTMLEPSANMYPVLVERLRTLDENHVGRAYQSTLLDALDRIGEPDRPDSIIYVNVLEHIHRDEQELAGVHSALVPRGRVLIFVPANPWLMGSIDYQLGHHRRYTMRELTLKCQTAGFRVLVSRYFDLLGIIPWWLKYRVLRSTRMEPGAVRFYDRWVVPISRVVEGTIRPPIGKNIMLVGEKSG